MLFVLEISQPARSTSYATPFAGLQAPRKPPLVQHVLFVVGSGSTVATIALRIKKTTCMLNSRVPCHVSSLPRGLGYL